MTDRFADIVTVSKMTRALRPVGESRLADASVRAGAYIGACVPPQDIARLDALALEAERLRRQFSKSIEFTDADLQRLRDLGPVIGPAQ